MGRNGKKNSRRINIEDSLIGFPEPYRPSLRETIRMYDGMDHYVLEILKLARDTGKIGVVNEQLKRVYREYNVARIPVEDRRDHKELGDEITKLLEKNFNYIP